MTLARCCAVLVGATRGGARIVLDALVPPQCLVCRAQVDAPGQFCAECFRGVTFLGDPCCARCGLGFAYAGQAATRVPGEGLLCANCAMDPPPWARARGALLYNETSRRLVLALKYADRTEHAAPLAAMMARAGAALLRDAELIVPVPLHRLRLLSRRYNQAALLALALGRLAARPVRVDALRRTRRTASLGHLSSAARAETLHDAFASRRAAEPALVGRRVLLVDDVLTSGATARACATVLLEAGAGAVDILVAARVGRLERIHHSDDGSADHEDD
jgi:ComF family protein